ncbi:MAG: hypothetical protein ACXAD7_20010 [Candidatus Kariarchaeaceae archaeon]|jgi:hypothetical protein
MAVFENLKLNYYNEIFSFVSEIYNHPSKFNYSLSFQRIPKSIDTDDYNKNLFFNED